MAIAKGATEKVVRAVKIPVTSASLNTCPIIKVDYFLKVTFGLSARERAYISSFDQATITTSGMAKITVSAQVPIIIGAVPTVRYGNRAPSDILILPNFRMVPVQASTMPAGATPIAVAPPLPSYEQCLGAGHPAVRAQVAGSSPKKNAPDHKKCAPPTAEMESIRL